MAEFKIVLYCDASGNVPLIDWLKPLPKNSQAKLVARIKLLSREGNKLRRPHCDYLEEGVYELRKRCGTVQYRILYAFVEGKTVLLTHGIVKRAKVPKIEIKRAIQRRNEYLAAPETHTYEYE